MYTQIFRNSYGQSSSFEIPLAMKIVKIEWIAFAVLVTILLKIKID